MNKLLLFSIIFSTFLYSQCENLGEYPCALNPECNWVSDNSQGLCNDLTENECRSGGYKYCYWSSTYNGQSECLGGTYSKSSSYCEPSNNIFKSIFKQYCRSSTDSTFNISRIIIFTRR